MLISCENPEPYSVISGGWECCDKEYTIDRANFPYFALEFVISGQGTLIIDDKKHSLIPGVFFSYGPDKPHKILMDERHPLEKYFVNIQCQNMTDFFGPDTAYLYGEVIHSVRPYLIQRLERKNMQQAHTAALAENFRVIDCGEKLFGHRLFKLSQMRVRS